MNVFFSALLSLALVLLISALGWGGAAVGLEYLLGVVIPYVAILLFLVGLIWRIVSWASSPVPFRIPTTCGQQKSLPWIKSNELESPHTMLGVLSRMALEVLLFRSLFRNTRSGLRTTGSRERLTYGPTKWLWMAALAFHWSFLIIFVRHFRFFSEPVPYLVTLLQDLDGFFQLGLPILLLTDVVILLALTYLVLRRLFIPQVRYISLPADYFPLFVILGIAFTGILMRYFYKVDVVAAKELGMGLLSLSPPDPSGIGAIFFVHLLLVSVLIGYFPFSKLMHMAGVFLSPTRNLANTNRVARHINPWNYPVKKHTYEEWEEEFREKIVRAGLPLDKPATPPEEA